MFEAAIPSQAYVDAAEVFHWATKRHFQLWFTGQAGKRHRRTEIVLRRLTTSGKLRAVRYGRRLVYCLPRKSKRTKGNESVGLTKVTHGLACTECLVRFAKSRPDGTVIPERYFSKLGAIPEWGIVYPNSTMLLMEFCTRSNFLFSGNITGKLSAYDRNIQGIERGFGARAVVVFVVDVKRDMLSRFVQSQLGNAGPYFFTDYETFLKVSIGQALYEPIYFWTYDGKVYPLAKHV